MPWLFSGMCRSDARLDGKTAVVTGANAGLGKETARDFAARGARVVMLVRDTAKGERAAADIRQHLAASKSASKDRAVGQLVVQRLDLASLQSVRECARLVLQQEGAIHILVNNAGIMACPKATTTDGHDLQFGVNHLGHFLLTVLLLPRLRATARDAGEDAAKNPVRIVTVSSLAYSFSRIDFDDLRFDKNYKPLMAYARSKLANMLFTRELARRLQEASIGGINTYCLHPGAVDTNLFRHFDTWLLPGTQFLLEHVGRFFIKTARQGAQTSIYCAVHEKTAQETGLYYKDCSATTPLAIGRDEEAARRLWDVSMAIVGLEGYDPLTASEPPAWAFQLPTPAPSPSSLSPASPSPLSPASPSPSSPSSPETASL